MRSYLAVIDTVGQLAPSRRKSALLNHTSLMVPGRGQLTIYAMDLRDGYRLMAMSMQRPPAVGCLYIDLSNSMPAHRQPGKLSSLLDHRVASCLSGDAMSRY